MSSYKIGVKKPWKPLTCNIKTRKIPHSTPFFAPGKAVRPNN